MDTTPKNPLPRYPKLGDQGVVEALEAFITQYVSFTDASHAFVAALWTIGTYLWPQFDAFPYLVITSATKRSGKTRLAETVACVGSNPVNVSGVTAAALFRIVREQQPTLFIDEAESMSGGSADTMRAFLNVGYRRGQTIPRVSKKGVEHWPAYCPKAFILIGDVYDTLRDRSIIVRMRRANPDEIKRRFLFEEATSEGQALRVQVAALVAEHRDAVTEKYLGSKGLAFLTDRDEEIWLSLYAICQVFAPHRLDAFKRAAVDLATEKTMAAVVHTDLEGEDAKIQDDEYAQRLLRDLHSIFKPGERAVFTADALARLRDMATGPWRKYLGDGLDAILLGKMLDRFNVHPRPIRLGGKQGNVARGYHAADVALAVKLHLNPKKG